MKRIDNLYDKICSIENLKLADKRARKGKSKQKGVINHDLNREANIQNLHYLLVNQEYKTSKYTIFTIKDPKEREIYRLPYYPDRIAHHAIMNILEPIFLSTFTRDTYNCIKKRGIHGALYALRKGLKNLKYSRYCLKFDIKKFYPSVNHFILKSLLKRKFKDIKLLNLLFEIINSAKGLPIGNYLSQFLANFYLTYFDHWIKEVLRVKYYYRYCDDIIILAPTKVLSWEYLNKIREYLKIKLNLNIKENYKVFPVKLGIDFVGYKSYPKYSLLRDRIKRRFIKMIRRYRNNRSIASYQGWLLHCNSINLRKKYIYETIKNK